MKIFQHMPDHFMPKFFLRFIWVNNFSVIRGVILFQKHVARGGTRNPGEIESVSPKIRPKRVRVQDTLHWQKMSKFPIKSVFIFRWGDKGDRKSLLIGNPDILVYLKHSFYLFWPLPFCAFFRRYLFLNAKKKVALWPLDQ